MEMARLLTQLLRRPAPANDRGASIPFDVASARPTDRSFTRELEQLRSSARDAAPAVRPEPASRPEKPASKSSGKVDKPRDDSAPTEDTQPAFQDDASAISEGPVQLAVALMQPVTSEAAERNAPAAEATAAPSSVPSPSDPAHSRSAASSWKALGADDKLGLPGLVDGNRTSRTPPEFKPLDQAIPIGEPENDASKLELAEKQKWAALQETSRAGWVGRRFIADASAHRQPLIKNQGHGGTTGSQASGGLAPETLSATAGHSDSVFKTATAVPASTDATDDAGDANAEADSPRAAAEGGTVAQRQAVAKSRSTVDSRQDRAGNSPANGSSEQSPSSAADRAGPSPSTGAGVGAAPILRGAVERVGVSRIEGDSAAASLAKALLAPSTGDASGHSAATNVTGFSTNAASSAGNVTSSGERTIASPAKSFSAIASHPSPAASRVAELLLAQQPASGGLDAAVRLLGGASGSGKQEVTLQLDPPELGRMRLEVRMEEQTMSLRVDVQSRAVAKLVETRLPELRDALSAHGISIDKSQVIIRTADAHGGSLGRESDSSGNQQPSGHHGGSEGYFSEGQAGRDGSAGQSWRDGWTPADANGSSDDAWRAAHDLDRGVEISGLHVASPASMRAGAMNLVA